MSHLQHCISNIPSITGRLRGEFKIALLQAIWVCGTQMCSLSCSNSDTRALKLMHSCCLTYKCSFPPVLSHTHTQIPRRQRGSLRLSPCPLHQTCASRLRPAQVDGWRCHGGAVAMARKRQSQRAGDSDEGESGRLPPSANNTTSTARSRHLVTVQCDEIQPRFPKCSASLRTNKLLNNSSIKFKSDRFTEVVISSVQYIINSFLTEFDK